MQTRYADLPAPRAGAHQDLRAWQAAAELAVECYLRTAGFPWIERYRLVAGMRRAAAAVVAHIVEGCDRASDRVLRSHLQAAHHAVRELQAQFDRAAGLGYLDGEAHDRARGLCEAASRALQELIASPNGRGAATGSRLTLGRAATQDAVIQ